MASLQLIPLKFMSLDWMISAISACSASLVSDFSIWLSSTESTPAAALASFMQQGQLSSPLYFHPNGFADPLGVNFSAKQYTHKNYQVASTNSTQNTTEKKSFSKITTVNDKTFNIYFKATLYKNEKQNS